MADNRIIRFALSDAGATAELGVNITNAEVVAKTDAGNNQLTARGSVSCYGICHDWSGNMYIADDQRHVILKISEEGPSNRYVGGTDYQVSTVAGLAGTNGNNVANMNVGLDPVTMIPLSRFNAPKGICCDRSGTLYVADTGNNQIRMIKDGLVSLFAGSGLRTPGLADGPSVGVMAVGGAQALFNGPTDVCVDKSGTVYVADAGNHAIRKIKGGTVTTLAGNGVLGNRENLTPVASNANTWPSRMNCFNTPTNVSVDQNGIVYVVDNVNRKIKKIMPDGRLLLHSGSGADGRSLGTTVGVLAGGTVTSKAYTCSYHDIKDIDIDESGNQYILDINSSNGTRIVKLDYSGIPGVVADFDTARTYNDNLKAIIVDPSQRIYVTSYIQ